jgi:hypothetical protein
MGRSVARKCLVAYLCLDELPHPTCPQTRHSSQPWALGVTSLISPRCVHRGVDLPNTVLFSLLYASAISPSALPDLTARALSSIMTPAALASAPPLPARTASRSGV